MGSSSNRSPLRFKSAVFGNEGDAVIVGIGVAEVGVGEVGVVKSAVSM
jgi:hypothetical protein